MADAGKGLVRYYREIKAEMKKVTWPTREQIAQYTSLTLLLIAILTFFFWIADSFFGWILSKILGV